MKGIGSVSRIWPRAVAEGTDFMLGINGAPARGFWGGSANDVTEAPRLSACKGGECRTSYAGALRFEGGFGLEGAGRKL